MTPKNEIATVGDSSLQMVPLEQMKKNYKDFVDFSKEILKDKVDFGIIPGTKTPTLLKPGAEKMRMVYGLGMEVEKIEDLLDLDRDFYSCDYRVTIKTKGGQTIGQCDGNSNTNESKYRYRWIECDDPGKEEYQKLKALGTHKKKQSYNNAWITLERVENENRIAIKNTIQKMAQKRAFVGAMVIAVGASEFFTQDLDDLAADLGINHEGEGIQEGEVEKPSEKKKETPEISEREKELAKIRKSDNKEDGTPKEWFNEDPHYMDFLKIKDNYSSYQEAIDVITLKYKVNRDMRKSLKDLYDKKPSGKTSK